MTPIGDFQGLEKELPFGHVDMIVPIEVPPWLGTNSARRNRLASTLSEIARQCGLRPSVIDDPDPDTHGGGTVKIQVQGLERHVEAFRSRIGEVDINTLEGDIQPRPYSMLPNRVEPQ